MNLKPDEILQAKTEYKKLRNSVNSALSSAKNDFYIKAFSNAKSSRNIWSTFKQYKNGNSEVSSNSVVVPANLNMSLPEYMAFYFKDKIARIRESFYIYTAILQS